MLRSDFQRLLRWYRLSQRALPWRVNSLPYPVMVSEFMLQQTTVAAVIPKFHAWMEKFPDIQCLASASLDEVLIQWSGLGYYQRARRLHEAAKEIVRLGEVPDSYEALLRLPGFGPYTAAAVASICFARAHLSLDTNVIRVLYRYYAIPRSAGEAGTLQALRKKMEPHLRDHHPGESNQALMELGATHCSVKEPSCLLCPLREGCGARIAPGGPSQFPLPSPKKKAKETPGRVLVVERSPSGEILLLKGTSLGLLSDLYQPPVHFFEEKPGNETAEGVHSMWKQLLEHPCSHHWKLSYAISGRKLRLECYCWSLGERDLENLLGGWEAGGLEYQWWDSKPDRLLPEKGNPLAVSSLTRRVLQRREESRVSAHPPDGKWPVFLP